MDPRVENSEFMLELSVLIHEWCLPWTWNWGGLPNASYLPASFYYGLRNIHPESLTYRKSQCELVAEFAVKHMFSPGNQTQRKQQSAWMYTPISPGFGMACYELEEQCNSCSWFTMHSRHFLRGGWGRKKQGLTSDTEKEGEWCAPAYRKAKRFLAGVTDD